MPYVNFIMVHWSHHKYRGINDIQMSIHYDEGKVTQVRVIDEKTHPIFLIATVLSIIKTWTYSNWWEKVHHEELKSIYFIPGPANIQQFYNLCRNNGWISQAQNEWEYEYFI